MRRCKAETIGDMIRQFLRREGLETPLNELRIVSAWPEVMGEGIARYTGEAFVRNEVLYIQIKSPALRANLMMNREALVARLNNHVGAQVIRNIIFR